jgi:hypothetical protein
LGPNKIGVKMDKIKLWCDKVWLNYNEYLIGAAVGLLVGIILF